MKRTTYIAIALAGVLTLATGCGTDETQANKDAYRQIGINCMEQGDYEGAVSAFQSALDQSLAEIGEEEIDTCYYKAAAQYAAGNTQDAIDTYQALIDYDKKNADAHYLLANLYLKEQNTTDANAQYKLAAEYAGNNYDLYIAIYNQLNATGDTQSAQEYLNLALENKGKSAEDYTSRGRIYLLLGDYENAKTQLDSAVEKKSVEANLYMAQLYEAQGEDEKAAALYESYVENNKEDPIALNCLGCMKSEAGDYKAAIEYFNMALALDNPSNVQELQKNLILAYEQNGNFPEARDAMAAYTKAYPKDEAAAREYLFLITR